MKDNNVKRLNDLLKEKKIHCSESENGLAGILVEDLATRSVYWLGMGQDLEDLFNECYHCNQTMDKNKKLEDLPEIVTTRPFKCISIDIFKTVAHEHALAIINRHIGYIWQGKIFPVKFPK